VTVRASPAALKLLDGFAALHCDGSRATALSGAIYQTMSLPPPTDDPDAAIAAGMAWW
jgi:hypothetical protein